MKTDFQVGMTNHTSSHLESGSGLAKWAIWSDHFDRGSVSLWHGGGGGVIDPSKLYANLLVRFGQVSVPVRSCQSTPPPPPPLH